MPTYSISAPDGNTYNISGPDGASQEQVQAEVMRRHPTAGQPRAPIQPPPAQAEPAQAPSFLDRAQQALSSMSGLPQLETLSAMGTGAVGKVAGDIAGLGAIPAHYLGLTNQNPSDVKSAVQNAMTYTPRTTAGQASTQALGAAADSTLGAAGRGIGQLAGGLAGSLGASEPWQDAANNGANEGTQQAIGFALPLVSKFAVTKGASMAQAALAHIPRQVQIDAARAAGYPIPPSEIPNAPVGKLLTGAAGKDQLNQAFSVASQDVTNKLAKSDLPIPDDVPLSHGSVAKVIEDQGAKYDAVRTADQSLVVTRDSEGNILKNPAGKPIVRQAGPVKPDAEYLKAVNDIGAESENAAFGTSNDAEVAALKQQLSGQSAFSPKDGLNRVKILRNDAQSNLKAVDKPNQLALGKAQMQAANVIEDQIARYLDKNGQTSLYNDFTTARTTIAKAKTIQENMDQSGRVDASAINEYRNKGGQVTGGLKQIADAADSFPKTVRNTQGIQAPAPVSALDYVMRGAAGFGLGHAAGPAGGGAGAAAGLLSLAARPAARGFLGSNMYQNLLKGQAPQAGLLSQIAANPATPLGGFAAALQRQSSQPAP